LRKYAVAATTTQAGRKAACFYFFREATLSAPDAEKTMNCRKVAGIC
jgi:hypothetical protein